MNDQIKFCKWTEPIKFRSVKQAVKSVGRTYGVGTNKILYIINNILYRLHIIDRYTYKNVDVRYSTPKFLSECDRKYVVGSCVSFGLDMTFEEEHTVNEDYFYVKTKRGKKKLFSVVDVDEKKLVVVGTPAPHTINLHIGNSWCRVPETNIFKAENAHGRKDHSG